MRIVKYKTWEKLMLNKASEWMDLTWDELIVKLLRYSRKFKIKGAQEAKEELEREYNIGHEEKNK